MQRRFTVFHSSVAVHVAVQGEALELRAYVAGAVGQMQSLKKHLDREAREHSDTLLAYDALADAVICRRSTTLSTVPLEGTVAHFAHEVIRFRHLLKTKEPATPNRETVKKRLLDAYHATRARDTESLLLRADAFAPEAADFLNAVNAILFDARHELAPDGDEIGALKALLCDMDLCMGAEPAGLVIRNAIAIQTEIMACRASLPAQWTLAHHDLDIWRLFMDGDAWTSDLGKYHFDNELGYMAGCLRAFRYLMSTRGQRLDARMLAKAHDVAVEVAFKRMPTPLVHRFQLGYRCQSVAFALIEGRNCSAEGLREFRSRAEAATVGFRSRLRRRAWRDCSPSRPGRPRSATKKPTRSCRSAMPSLPKPGPTHRAAGMTTGRCMPSHVAAKHWTSTMFSWMPISGPSDSSASTNC